MIRAIIYIVYIYICLTKSESVTIQQISYNHNRFASFDINNLQSESRLLIEEEYIL